MDSAATSIIRPLRRSAGRRRRSVGDGTGIFLATFAGAWFALDRLVTSPPTAASATWALGVAGAVVVAGERLSATISLADLAARIGLGRPTRRGLAAAMIVGGSVVATYLLGGALLGIDLELRANWPTVFVGALIFHGLAEELVWRGYVFGRLRRRRAFWPAMAWSVPLLALTHVPIIVTNGPVIGVLAVFTAAVVCLPLAHLWELSGRTVWAAAIVHGLIGTWQLFERTYGVEFQLVVFAASILVPLLALRFDIPSRPREVPDRHITPTERQPLR